ncbi:hypothetical protein tpqmel_0766 [Candidatus Gastranaerophilus sp. (ex Termes propinquus)]|nr:hypothetical protein tpqmel_0766 [Candidatus Gastranaerophilus sp. (ex Termes propinquus)]
MISTLNSTSFTSLAPGKALGANKPDTRDALQLMENGNRADLMAQNALVAAAHCMSNPGKFKRSCLI